MSSSMLQFPQQQQLQDNRRIIKTFLINGQLNKVGFRIRHDYIPKHIQKFVGRPVVLTAERFHSKYDDVDFSKSTPEVIEQLLRSQQKDAVGFIRKIEESADAIKSGGISVLPEYNCYIELTHSKAIEALNNGKLPQYVSPTIYKLNKDDPDDAITDYEPLHIAFVDIPAWGNVAKIKGSCNGDLMTCQEQLKNNGIIMIKNNGIIRPGDLLLNFVQIGEKEGSFIESLSVSALKQAGIINNTGIVNQTYYSKSDYLLLNFISSS